MRNADSTQRDIKTIYVGISVDNEPAGRFYPHRLFYILDLKPSECSMWGRGERGVDDLDEGVEGEDRRGCSCGIKSRMKISVCAGLCLFLFLCPYKNQISLQR